MSDNTYKEPNKVIADLIGAPKSPLLSISHSGKFGLLMTSHTFPPISELTRPTLGLAGIRFNPETNGPGQLSLVEKVTLLHIETKKESQIDLPEQAFDFCWAPSEDIVYFLSENEKTVSLWSLNAKSKKAKKLTSGLNCLFGRPFDFSPDGRLLVKLIPGKRGERPKKACVPTGPIVRFATGVEASVRTYRDLLTDEHSTRLFAYYAASQLAFLCPHTKTLSLVRQPGLYTRCKVSPNLHYMLVETLSEPFSYLVPWNRFPTTVEIWGRMSTTHKLDERPLTDNIPIKGVHRGKRHIHWLPNEDARLCYVEALDEGDPKKETPHRDRLVLSTPEGKEEELHRLPNRFSHIIWLDKTDKCLLAEYDWKRRWLTTHLYDYKNKTIEKTLFDRAIHDLYNDPGLVITKRTKTGGKVARVLNDKLLFHGQGATPEGNKPFIAQLSLTDYSWTEVYRSSPPPHREFHSFVNEQTIITTTQAQQEALNYELFHLETKKTDELTNYPNALSAFTKCERRLLNYERKDGVALSGVLHLPADYKAGEKRPLLIWAYPRGYTSAKTASQVRMSHHRFPTLTKRWHNLLALAGYVVLDRTQVPIVGTPETMNDSYVEQVVSSLAAAIDKLDELGYIDRQRVALGGHSYGAFMVANALAHSDLFAAGVASNGAYNRTLTPFGFQGERRTLWQAQQTYLEMSPFLHADKIDSPLLLFHGERDDNEGTFPLQSKRLFHALKGLGKKARLVLLPLESHHYRARETVLHYLAEMLAWFNEMKG